MPLASELLDGLLRLGDEIAEAIEAENWSRLSGLVDQRSEIARRLPSVDAQNHAVDFPRSKERKLDALADQNDRLTTMLQERRDQLEDEIVRVEQLRHAQDSYEQDSYEATKERDGVLPSKLRG